MVVWFVLGAVPEEVALFGVCRNEFPTILGNVVLWLKMAVTWGTYKNINTSSKRNLSPNYIYIYHPVTIIPRRLLVTNFLLLGHQSRGQRGEGLQYQCQCWPLDQYLQEHLFFFFFFNFYFWFFPFFSQFGSQSHPYFFNFPPPCYLLRSTAYTSPPGGHS